MTYINKRYDILILGFQLEVKAYFIACVRLKSGMTELVMPPPGGGEENRDFLHLGQKPELLASQRISSGRARFSKRVNFSKKASLTIPVGPFLCLPMMISAIPFSGLSSDLLYTSSR